MRGPVLGPDERPLRRALGFSRATEYVHGEHVADFSGSAAAGGSFVVPHRDWETDWHGSDGERHQKPYGRGRRQ